MSDGSPKNKNIRRGPNMQLGTLRRPWLIRSRVQGVNKGPRPGDPIQSEFRIVSSYGSAVHLASAVSVARPKSHC